MGTCNAEIMAYQMKQHGRSLRSRRSLDAAPFFSGAIMGHQKNHGGRSLSRYYKGNFPKRPFSQRPYRGPWRGGTVEDYRAWAAYQQTPTKAEPSTPDFPDDSLFDWDSCPAEGGNTRSVAA